jgi:hypothetical protein
VIARSGQARLDSFGADVVAGSPNDLAKRMKAGYAKWAALFPNQARKSAQGAPE